ncbi:uncharacterized protein LOC124703058 isoform X2 [Lolium rigidum]|uniref:uncharacterized protein LOC124703058 isoform X2 n=1 Tax=Lolium rigidum TaxID=89674 RepID=UPI001F5C2757|nr:uncharacterized protein LOC124703058 isoform X2 [Lolium rigidum]
MPLSIGAGLQCKSGFFSFFKEKYSCSPPILGFLQLIIIGHCLQNLISVVPSWCGVPDQGQGAAELRARTNKVGELQPCSWLPHLPSVHSIFQPHSSVPMWMVVLIKWYYIISISSTHACSFYHHCEKISPSEWWWWWLECKGTSCRIVSKYIDRDLFAHKLGKFSLVGDCGA